MKNIIKIFSMLIISSALFAEDIIKYSMDSNFYDSNYIEISYDENDELFLGNPSKATFNLEHSENLLIRYNGFSMSYNSKLHIPNWVAWHLSSSDLGKGRYSGSFYSDDNLPYSILKVKHSDYSNSGFDRGHMCPSADRNSTIESSKTTFITTNILPQSSANNEIVWNNLESVEQNLASSGYEVYIYAGGIGFGGENKNGEIVNSISKKEIAVPEYTWKIIIAIEEGDNDLDRINENTKVIAVLVPNNLSCHKDAEAKGYNGKDDWKAYQVSIDYIEEITGYDFLSILEDSIENFLEK